MSTIDVEIEELKQQITKLEKMRAFGYYVEYDYMENYIFNADYTILKNLDDDVIAVFNTDSEKVLRKYFADEGAA